MTLGTGRIQACLNWCGNVDVDSERLKRHESGEQKTVAPSRRNQPGGSGVAMGWAGWAKSRGPPSEGAPKFQANF